VVTRLRFRRHTGGYLSPGWGLSASGAFAGDDVFVFDYDPFGLAWTLAATIPLNHTTTVGLGPIGPAPAGLAITAAGSLNWVPTFYVLVARTTRGHDGGVACSDCSDCQPPVENRSPAMTTIASDLLNRAKQEYVEMPGLVLTTRQASRLWNLDAAVCQALLSTLVHEQFLSLTHGGAYLRRGSGNSTVPANEPDEPAVGPR
jgi:hypothetical protein